MWRAVVFLLVAAVGWVGQAVAADMFYYTRYVGDEIRFRYVWALPGGNLQTLEFALPVADVQRGATEFKNFSQAELDMAILKALKDKAAEMSNAERTVKVMPRFGNRITLQVQGLQTAMSMASLSDVQASLRQAQDDTTREVLARDFYREAREPNEIMPDHPRIARRYAPAMRPVALAIRRKLDTRDQRATINWILGWLQRVPYDRLTNRYMGGDGAGYQTPYGMLLNNRGDCDTKSVVLMALLREIYPDMPLAMVYAEDHAFVAVGIEQGRDDYGLRLDDKVTVLADPTGPALVPLGGVGERTRQALEQGNFWHLWM